jgi:hypothetical protein
LIHADVAFDGNLPKFAGVLQTASFRKT